MAREDEAELSIGGPGGVHIRVGGTPVVRPTPEHELSTVVAFARSHPRAVAGGLAFAGLAMLIGPAVLISLIGLPWLLYVGPVLLSVTAFGLAAAAARGGGSIGTDARELERRVLDLAVRSRGRLTVTATAHALGISLGEADAALMALVRADHVDVENDPHTGAVVYVFRDLRAQLAARSS